VDGTGRAVIDLTNLASADGFIIRGEGPRDFVGRSVASGDINGDGFDDLIVGATTYYLGYSSPNAYVIFARPADLGTVDSGRSVLDAQRSRRPTAS
jgi:hypothetical protein